LAAAVIVAGCIVSHHAQDAFRRAWAALAASRYLRQKSRQQEPKAKAGKISRNKRRSSAQFVEGTMFVRSGAGADSLSFLSPGARGMEGSMISRESDGCFDAKLWYRVYSSLFVKQLSVRKVLTVCRRSTCGQRKALAKAALGLSAPSTLSVAYHPE
jgi:hypothetical protein